MGLWSAKRGEGLTHWTVRFCGALQTDKDRPEEDVEGDVLCDGEFLHEERVRSDEDDVASVKGRAEIVELVLGEVCVLE